MQATDMPNFAKIMAGLSELYNQRLSEAVIEIYWLALKHFSIQALHHAVSSHISNPDTGQFMPKPAELLRYIEGGANDKAMRAWHKVIHAIRAVGQYETVVFDDPVIHVVIADLGGWINLCRTSEKEMSFRIIEFEKRYRHYLRHPPSSYPKNLTGLINGANISKGLVAQSPTFIGGDPNKALQVYQEDRDNLSVHFNN